MDYYKMPRLPFLKTAFVLLIGLATAVAQTGNGYNYGRAVVIDHRQVQNSDQTDFPVLISGAFPFLATTANGGYVQNSNGYDIIFTSDAAGQTKLDHEIDNYDPTTGNAGFWVRIPTLSHTTDTTIYIWYGNIAVTTSQENKAGVWRNNYGGVWHFGGTTINSTDSTANGNNAINNGVAGRAGKFGVAGSFDGTGGTYFRIPSNSSFKPSAAVTMEAWVNTGSASSSPDIFSLDYRADGSWSAPYQSYALYFLNNTLQPGIGVTVSGTQTTTNSAGAIPSAQWAHVVGTYDGSTMTVYVNGVAVLQGSKQGSIDYGTSQDLNIGTRSPYSSSGSINGLIDEARISTVARSANWIATEYNNQNSPSTFAFMCPASALGGQPNPCSLQVPPGGLANSVPIVISHTNVSNSDRTDFPVLVSGTFPYLATVANGGQVQNSNGYDIEFSSDAAGQNQLDHEIDTYNPVNGTVNFWVRIPTLSHTADTTIYLWYGNTSVVASQENKTGVWRNNYAGVWHFGSSALNSNDSTANGNNGSNHGVTSKTGKFGLAGGFDGTGNTYFVIPASSSFKPTSAITMEAWVNMTGATSWPDIFSLDYRADGSWSSPYQAYALDFNSNTLEPRIDVAANGSQAATNSATSIATGQWIHIAGTYDGSKMTVYANGASVAQASQTGSISYGTSKALDIGTRSPYTSAEAVNGSIDEARISTVARSADWIATEYNNQNSPSTFASAPTSFTIASGPTFAANQYSVYSQTLSALGGTAPYSWSITSGFLPTGLSLSTSTGVISGTATSAGTSNFTLQATDANSHTATRAISIVVNSVPPLLISTTSLGSGKKNSSYSAILNASGGVPPYAWSVSYGAIPSGLVLGSGSGIISGMPTAAGISNFTIQIQDSTSTTASQALSITVSPADNKVAYSYDDLGRLVGVADQDGNSAGYSYDAVGNILSISRSNAGQLSILSFSPRSGPVGTQVTISGSGFSSTASQDTVSFNGAAATISSASPTQLIATVPAGATSGPIGVTSTLGSANSSTAFTVGAGAGPTITGFVPTTATVGTALTVNGTNFDLNTANDLLGVNNIRTAVSTATATSLTSVVPTATSGRISVQTPHGTAVSTQDLFVPFGTHVATDVGFTARTTLGSAQTVSLNSANKIALVLFDASAGQSVSLQLSSSTFSSCTLYLLAPNGTQLVSSGCTSSTTSVAKTTLSGTGTYTIGIDAGASTGSITLTLVNTSDVTGTITIGGPPVTVTTTVAAQDGRLTFSGSPGERIFLQVTNVTNPGATVILLAPSGSQQANVGISSGFSAYIDTQTLTSGTYTLWVQHSNNNIGSETLTLTSVPHDLTGSASIGGPAVRVPASGTFVIGQNATLTFSNATVGQKVSFNIINPDVFSACSLYVLDPNGARLAITSCSPGANPYVDTITLQLIGAYSVLFDPGGPSVGSVSFQINNDTDVTGTMSIDGGPVTTTTTAPGQDARLTFSGTAGQRVFLQVTNITNPSATVALLTPSGSQQASTSIGSGGPAYIDTQTLATTGTYTLWVKHSGSNAGSETLTLTSVLADFTATTTIGGSAVRVPTTGSLALGQNATVTFNNTTVGQKVSFNVSNSSISSACNISVLDPNGSRVGIGFCSTGSNPSFGPITLQLSGTYSIFLDPQGTATGTVTIAVVPSQ